MYFILRDSNNKTLCEVNIHAKQDMFKKDKYAISLSSYFNINNYSHFLIHQSLIDQKRIIEDFATIQDCAAYFYENTGIYPECKQYDLKDPNLTKDKAIIISTTREILRKIADKYGLDLSED